MAICKTAIPGEIKLKTDAIVEVVFEIRFDTKTIPEILFGRLADYPPLGKALISAQMRPHIKYLRQFDRPIRVFAFNPSLNWSDLANERYAIRLGVCPRNNWPKMESSAA